MSLRCLSWLLLSSCCFTLACGASPGLDGGTGGGSNTGGGTGGAGSASTVTGSVNGRTLAIQSAAAQRFTAFTGGGLTPSVSHEGLLVRLSEHSAVCNTASPVGVAATDKRVVTLRIDLAPDAGAVNAGQFTGSVSVAAPDCSSTMSTPSGLVSELTTIESSQAAMITLTETTGRVRGTFSATLRSGAPISGGFDADFCAFCNWESLRYVQCR